MPTLTLLILYAFTLEILQHWLWKNKTNIVGKLV